ncbi:MAG: protein-export chaperone SecB [Nitrosomonadales bacterium]|nr:MAG: protein-export chaperone SecB [Nitrosomonadales bacterium]
MSEAQEEQVVFGIEKIYVKDLSLEIPNAPQIFLEQGAPAINVEFHTKAEQLGEGVYEAVLTVTVTSKLAEGDKTLFLVEAAQAGIFRISNVPQEDIEPLLGIACPNILYPYAREAVSDMVTRAGFPPVVLQPMNFEAIYQHQKQMQANQNPSATTH